MANQLEIHDLYASIEGEPILKGVNLVVPQGEVHALMGPNGAGKSTLGKIIAGDPEYTVDKGEVLVDGENILAMEADERAKKGLFLAFQYPVEVPGVTIANFLRLALNAKTGKEVSVSEFYAKAQAGPLGVKRGYSPLVHKIPINSNWPPQQRCRRYSLS